ncbi:hypothetical protein LY76DRAFT_466056, partial [Colletotrichum caudatum]
LMFYIASDSARRLYIPKPLAGRVFSLAHDEKFHFRRVRMLAELRNFHIPRKAKLVKSYI